MGRGWRREFRLCMCLRVCVCLLSEGMELATELGIELDEAELIRTNSTGLTIYNPSNLASMIKGMKNKQSANTREAKILARKQYEEYAYKDIN